MAEEVEVDPSVGRPPFLAAKNIAVEGARLLKIGYVIGEMKWCQHDHDLHTIVTALPTL